MTRNHDRGTLAPVSLPNINVPIHPDWPELSESETASLKGEIAERLKECNGVLVAHYYTDGKLQDLAEETGGCVADSLEMARFGTEHPASTLVVAGVRFMGETAKILNPDKVVIVLRAGETDSQLARTKLELIGNVNLPIVGAVLNAVPTGSHYYPYYANYYYADVEPVA